MRQQPASGAQPFDGSPEFWGQDVQDPNKEPFAAEQRVGPERTCPVCSKPDWCAFTSNGRFVLCQRCSEWNGVPAIRHTDGGWLFPLAEPVEPVSPSVDRAPGNPHTRAEMKQEGASHPEPLDRITLDKIWRRIAELCGLEQVARDDIVGKRSFPGALETGVPYFSLPRSGKKLQKIMDVLIAEFGEARLRRVPGMNVQCRDCRGWGSVPGTVCAKCEGRGAQPPQLWSVRGDSHDYVVCALDEGGLAFWATKRRLPFDPAQDEKKYTLLSGSRAGEATLSGLPKYHLAGRRHPQGRVFITEGIIKAEVIADQLRCPVIGIYSTSVDDETLAEVLRVVQGWGAREVVIAFDADKHDVDAQGRPTRANVLKGEQKLIEAFQPIADVYSAEWDLRDGKGFDDLLVARGSYTTVDRYAPPRLTARVPRPCAPPRKTRSRPMKIEDVRRKTYQLIERSIEGRRRRKLDMIVPPPRNGEDGECAARHGGATRSGANRSLPTRPGGGTCLAGLL